MKIQTDTETNWSNVARHGGRTTASAQAPRHRSPVTRDSAFTLIELLLVLVILATLAAIVLPRFTGTSKRAKITAAVTQISTFKTALNAYEVDMGTYPKTLQDLIVRPQNAGQDWHGPYLDSDTIPKDPWGDNYIYTFPGRHNPSSFDLMSPGPDQQAGTSDDICNWTTGNNGS